MRRAIIQRPTCSRVDTPISAEAPGLTSGELRRLTLTVGDRQIVNIKMRFATISATVDVEAGTADVEFGSAAVSHVVTGRTVRDLPLNGRDWTRLPALEPGVSLILYTAQRHWREQPW